MTQPATADRERDPRVAELLDRVEQLRCALAAHPAHLADRQAADEELTALAALARGRAPGVAELRSSLLLIVGALGSVSALSDALGGLRRAVELFGRPVRESVR
jgi:hypothetical protein